MDDPWGSPWADDVPLENKKAIGQGPKATVTTQAPAKAATLVMEVNANSPWNDDEVTDDFGDWSVSPSVGGPGANQHRDEEQVAWPSIAGREESSNIHTKPLSPSWEEDFALSQTPRLAPSLMPKEALRQPSPDPWAKAFVAGEGPGETIAKDTTLNDRVLHSSQESTHHILPLPANGLAVTSEVPTITDNAAKLADHDIEDGSSEGPRKTVESPQSPQFAEPTTSRPSSSPSTGSQREGPPDSSRTSFDDEPKRPQQPRKVSAKIQELVEHFDGLATQSEEIPQDVGRKLSQCGKDSEEDVSDEGADDFGDFEEEGLGSESCNESSEEFDESIQMAVANNTPGTPIARASPLQSPKSLPVKEPTSPHRTRGSSIKPVEINVDLAILDTLYPIDDAIHAQEPIFIPDTLPHDSFSSTEERKMWYRISRYGPMRQHNSGDDENYVRISWPKSNVRDETLQIVARWMDEDRISGQIILGGAGKTSSVFGWNESRTAPVSLETAFAARDRKRTAPSTTPTVSREATEDSPRPSLSQRDQPLLEQGHMSTTHVPAGTTEESKASQISPVANFGWNFVPDKSSAPEQMKKPPELGFATSDASLPIVSSSSSAERKSLSPLRPFALAETFTATEHAQPVPLTPVDTSIKIPDSFNPLSPPASSLTTNSKQDDEDDDWGDLVSSPAVTTTAVFQPPFPLRHKKSQSLNDGRLSSFDSSKTFAAQSLQKLSGHRSSTSFDEILTPTYQANSSPTNFSELGDSAFPPSTSPPRRPSVHRTESKEAAVPITNDSWASMDFSFFETTSVPQPKLPLDFQESTVPNISYSPGSTSVLVPPSTGLQSNKDHEQNITVQRIVSGLPDLSYMLRR